MAATIETADMWKSKARSLQLRLRDRFRVAVHRRLRRHPIFSDDQFLSSTILRGVQRFHDFRTEALPSSSAFYRKRVSENFSDGEESVVQHMLQAVAVPIIGNVCHVFMHGLNRIQVYGVEKLHDALLHRPQGKPLITVSNHVASVDDPFIIAALLPPRVLLDAQNLRWTLCATDRCFKNSATSAFFRSVKVLPVSRGDGIYQKVYFNGPTNQWGKGMDMAISKLNRGGWVHIFPEGSRSCDGGRTMRSSKRGVGRLILDADNVPMVVPFVHTGMNEIMPIGANLPRIGKTVTVLIGDPIHFDDLLNGKVVNGEFTGTLYDAVASRIGHHLHELKIKVDQLALQQETELQNIRGSTTDRAFDIIHQVDWESFGIGNFIYTDEEASLMQDLKLQPPKLDTSHQEEHESSDWYGRAGVSYKCGITSRVRNFMDQTEFMGFAARGLFMNSRVDKLSASPGEVGPLKIWKQFVEANVVGQWNYC